MPSRNALIILFAALAAFSRSDASAADAPDPAIGLDWQVTFGGVAVASFRFDAQVAGDTYHVAFDGHTVGVAAIMFPATVTATTAGMLTAGLPAPTLYVSNSSGSLTRHAKLEFHDGTAPRVELQPPLGKEDEGPTTPIPPGSLVATIDPLSSLLALSLKVDMAKGCAGAIRVFDGRRRYDLTIAAPGPKAITARSGPYQELAATSCAMHVVPIGGYPVDRAKAMADNDSIFWLATPPGLARPVPIEIAFTGRWGVLRAVLTKPATATAAPQTRP